jgi:hypothetical protein
MKTSWRGGGLGRLRFGLLLIPALGAGSLFEQLQGAVPAPEPAALLGLGAERLALLQPPALRSQLQDLLARLTDKGSKDFARDQELIPKELLFIDDLVIAPLRECLTKGCANATAAAQLLWFLGDKEDIAAATAKLPNDSCPAQLVPPGLTRRDLAEDLRAIREILKLGELEFRTDRLNFNRGMTKAYVRVNLGPAAANSAPWGLMFHREEAGWHLVWTRPEGAARAPAVQSAPTGERATFVKRGDASDWR